MMSKKFMTVFSVSGAFFLVHPVEPNPWCACWAYMIDAGFVIKYGPESYDLFLYLQAPGCLLLHTSWCQTLWPSSVWHSCPGKPHGSQSAKYNCTFMPTINVHRDTYFYITKMFYNIYWMHLSIVSPAARYPDTTGVLAVICPEVVQGDVPVAREHVRGCSVGSSANVRARWGQCTQFNRFSMV